MKKSVLFLIPNLGHGGAEKVLVNLVNNLNAERFDITVQTIFDGGVNKQYLLPHIHYKSWKKHTFRGYTHLLKLFSKKRLYNLIVKNRFDYVISFLEGTSTRIIAGCPYEDSIKISWVHTEIDSLKMLSRCFKSVKEVANCYSSFDRIVFVSEGVKKVFAETVSQLSDGIGLYADKFSVFYNVNETEIIKEKAKDTVDDAVFSTDAVNIISVGKLIQVKGYDRLISAVAELNKELPQRKIHLYLVGVGGQERKLFELSREYNISDKVTFLGFKDNPYKYVAKCDLYVCSSRVEGFSTAVTEALVVGTPVVSTRCSGAVELLGENNEFGVVCENSQDGIYSGIKYIIDGDRLSYYKNKAIERGAYFSKEATTSAVEKMLLELADEK